MNPKETKVDDDRISALPDGILCHILSFLPTKYAFLTTLLSTRWKPLFSSLPNLDFNDTLLLHPTDGINVCSFTSFVYRVLLLLNTSQLDRFRLDCYVNWNHINIWIRAALLRSVKELDISAKVRVLPSNIFNSTTLVVLKLVGEFDLSVPSLVCLPKLKVLHLGLIKFTDDDSIRRVFLGCPVLEELKLSKCILEDVQILDISIPSLKSLDLNFMGGKHQMALNAPILEYLRYVDYVPGGYLVKDLKSLINAHLFVGAADSQVKEDSLYYGNCVAQLVNRITGVKFLHLSGVTLAAINYSNCSLATFNNLTHLELGVDLVNGWPKLHLLLASSPNLEVLYFVQGFVNYTEDDWKLNYCLPDSVPICLSRCLKEIKVRKFGGKEDELKLIEYFLDGGEVLKKITLYTVCLVKCSWCNFQKLFKFPRRSKACQILLEDGRCLKNEHKW